MELTVNTFLENLAQLSGDKIVTLAYDNGKVQKFDVSHCGKIGYDPSHLELFCMILQSMLNTSGSIVIRQFLPVSVTNSTNNRLVPRKNLYGAFISHGSLRGLTANELKNCYQFDQKKPLELEKEIYFRDFPTITSLSSSA